MTRDPAPRRTATALPRTSAGPRSDDGRQISDPAAEDGPRHPEVAGDPGGRLPGVDEAAGTQRSEDRCHDQPTARTPPRRSPAADGGPRAGRDTGRRGLPRRLPAPSHHRPAPAVHHRGAHRTPLAAGDTASSDPSDHRAVHALGDHGQHGRARLHHRGRRLHHPARRARRWTRCRGRATGPVSGARWVPASTCCTGPGRSTAEVSTAPPRRTGGPRRERRTSSPRTDRGRAISAASRIAPAPRAVPRPRPVARQAATGDARAEGDGGTHPLRARRGEGRAGCVLGDGRR